MRTAQKLRVNRAREIEIIRVDGFAGAFGHRIDFAERLSDYREFLLCHPITLGQIFPDPSFSKFFKAGNFLVAISPL
jgi:hypothetical protein